MRRRTLIADGTEDHERRLRAGHPPSAEGNEPVVKT